VRRLYRCHWLWPLSKMPAVPLVSFSHVHLYVDSVKGLDEYKKLEGKLNEFCSISASPSGRGGSSVGCFGDIAAARASWEALGATHGHPCTGQRDPEQWNSSTQDIIEQMLVGLGWRITAVCERDDTRSLLVTSRDSAGVQVVVTAHKTATMQQLAEQAAPRAEKRPRQEGGGSRHFDASNLARFAKQQRGREGIAVLGFAMQAGGVEQLHARYRERHPKLLLTQTPDEYDGTKVLEVYAYYKGERATTDADPATVLRFVESSVAKPGFVVLPGLQPVAADFDGTSLPAFCDHWVSNVFSRTSFLETMQDTLGFTPKVDFNAGVVAAGEAQIESTVTGNDPKTVIPDASVALKDQSQVYLPTNNALSEVGHVHLYLKEIGQGVQHVASKVADLPALVQRANDFRKITGAGLSFLSIPRSYYGILRSQCLSKAAGIDVATAERCVEAVTKAGVCSQTGEVDLNVTLERVVAALPAGVDVKVAQFVLQARYSNMYSLLRDQVSEETYLKIVRNNILVDVQGEDLLFQIFTSKILQRESGEEAPFFEFIQRVCSERKDPATGEPKPLRPGCGGFGIRNFLTLFLSIEVSKAAKARFDALNAGRARLAAYYGSMVEAFTAQLDESNPVLTAISDAMTAEGEALERGDRDAAAAHSEAKARGQQDLMAISEKYKDIMRDLRMAAPAGA